MDGTGAFDAGPHPARTVTIPGTAVVTSPLGFGCADLYREPASRRRRRLLDAAHAAGIRHFDVAPMYGLGLAEPELGRFARRRRDAVVIVTKFGIAPTALCAAIGRVQGPARRLLAAAPALRSRARSSAAGPASGPAGALLYRATGFDAAAACSSLERSLRALGTDYVDLLLLHDPQPGDARSDDVCAYLEQARQEGRIRSWGVAGEPRPSVAVAAALPARPPVVQLRDDILAPADWNGFDGRIAFGVLGRTLDRVVAHVGADAARRRRWEAAVGCDCAVPEAAARLLLRRAASRAPDGVILFSSIQERHLQAAAEALDPAPAADDEQLMAFTELVREEVAR